VNSDLKNGMQQHGSVFRIPEEITSLDYFSLSSTDSFSNMEEEYMRKKNIIFTLCYHTLGNSSYLQSSVELEEKKKEQGEPYNIKKRVCRIHLLSCLNFYLLFTSFSLFRLCTGGSVPKRPPLEVNYGFSNCQVSLYCPWQVKEFSHDKFEDLVHIYVMFRT
jgi:hypothetical protein